MSIFTKIKRMLTDDHSHDKHYPEDSQYGGQHSESDHHHDDHHGHSHSDHKDHDHHEHGHSEHHHDDHDHEHDKKYKKHKDDKWDFFD